MAHRPPYRVVFDYRLPSGAVLPLVAHVDLEEFECVSIDAVTGFELPREHLDDAMGQAVAEAIRDDAGDQVDRAYEDLTDRRISLQLSRRL